MTLPESTVETVADLLTVCANDPNSLGYIRDRFHEEFRKEFTRRGSGWIEMSTRKPVKSDGFGPREEICFKFHRGLKISRWDNASDRHQATHWCSLGRIEE